MRLTRGRGLNILTGILGVALALVAWLLVPGDEHPHAPAMAALVVLMAIWWVFEVIPIPATSLLPIVLLPALGIMDVEHSTAFYGKATIFLFLGGFILALGMQESNVHRRLALHILKLVGTQPRRLVLGFMVATGFLSMWINNTSTVMVMLPIALSILSEGTRAGADARQVRNFSVALMLGIAYAADIGGMATIIGTAPNLVYRQVMATYFPAAPKVEFIDWLKMGLPLGILYIGLGWLLLVRVAYPVRDQGLLGNAHLIDDNLKALGKLRRDEGMTLAVFAAAALLWITASEEIKLSEGLKLHGWRSIDALKGITDEVVAMLCALLLFFIPSRDRPGKALMEWRVAERLPWGVLLLFGGGFAIAGGIGDTGLSQLIGNVFADLPQGSPLLLVTLVVVLLMFLTEFTSNTAITLLTLPILAEASKSLMIDPRVIMIPATLAASCAFMMPVASPTQAIVFGSGYVTIPQMIRGGIWFNLLGLLLIGGFFLLIAQWAFGVDVWVQPAWATDHQR